MCIILQTGQWRSRNLYTKLCIYKSLWKKRQKNSCVCVCYGGEMTEKIVADTTDGESGGRQARSFVFFLEHFWKNNTISKLNFFKFTFGDDRIAQRSQSHGILPEPPWQVVHRHFSLQLQGSQHPLLASWGYLRTHSIGTQRRIHGHINKNKSLRNWLCTRFLKACMLSSSQARLATDTDCLEAADFLGAR